jgi:hypothetical protein
MIRSPRRRRLSLRSFLAIAFLVGIPLLLVMIALGTRAQDPFSRQAYDAMQLARNLANGEGFVTNAIRPLSLSMHVQVDNHPDLYQAPLYPSILAIGFAVSSATPEVVSAIGGLFWLVAISLSWLLARRYLSLGESVVVALCLAFCASFLVGSVTGMVYPLLASLSLGVILLSGVGGEVDVPGWQVAVAGVLSGLLVLVHPLMLALLPVMVMALWPRGKWQVGGLFLVGFVVCVLPWLIRNWFVGGNPLFSLYLYELAVGTRTFPGDTLWQGVDVLPPHPFWFALTHPLQMTGKFLENLSRFERPLFTLLNPFVVAIFLSSLFREPSSLRTLSRATLGLILMTVGLACLFRFEPGLLLAWYPLMVTVSLAHAFGWMKSISPEESVILPRWLQWGRKDPRSRRRRISASLFRGIAALALLAATFLPMMQLLFFSPATTPSPIGGFLEESMTEFAPGEGWILTDQPEEVAWILDRPTVDLCRTESGLDRIIGAVGSPAAAVISRDLRGRPREEVSPWWFWLAAPGGTFRNLEPAPSMPPGIMLRVDSRE